MNKNTVENIRILLGEDDQDDALLFIQAIQEERIQAQIETADNGRTFIDRIQNFRNPDLVFLDINIPLKNGFSCLSSLRSSSKTKKLPVIIWSTSQNEEEIKLCYDGGANYYVVKPYSYSSFKKMVSHFCNFKWENYSKPDIGSFVVSFDA